MKTRDELEEERRAGGDQKETSFIGVWGAIIIIVGALVIGLFLMFARDDEEAAEPAPPLPAATPAVHDSIQCARLLEVSRRAGLVRGPLKASRVRVDDARWAALDAKARRDLIDSVSCAAFDGRSLDDLQQGERVEVQDAATGRLLTTAGVAANGAVIITDAQPAKP